MREEAKRWFRQAEEDLTTAEATLERQRYYAAVQFAQQAVEKALKGLFIEVEGKPPPRTHDLVGLGESVNVPRDLLSDVEILGNTYFPARYPDATPGSLPAQEFNREDAQHYLDVTKRVLAWVRERLSTL